MTRFTRRLSAADEIEENRPESNRNTPTSGTPRATRIDTSPNEVLGSTDG